MSAVEGTQENVINVCGIGNFGQGAGCGISCAFEGTMLFVSHDRHFLSVLSNRVLELTPEGIHQYGGGYTEYVARTGQEAPGLRS